MEGVGLRPSRQGRDDAEAGAGMRPAGGAEAHGVEQRMPLGERHGEARVEGVSRAGRVHGLDGQRRHHFVQLVRENERASPPQSDDDVADPAPPQLTGQLPRGARVVGRQAQQDPQLASRWA